jgi:hypothetical protein
MLQFWIYKIYLKGKVIYLLIEDCRANTIEYKILLFSVFSASLAVTEEIPVGFYFCAALTNMLKFSAYPRLSWW